MKPCKLSLNYAGYCTAKASHAVKGDAPTDIRFRALFGLIQHPELGWILFDTGYTRRFYEATRSFPNKIYALMTKVFIEEKHEIKAQLQQAGISPDEVQHIIVSHFHADHIGGLKDFPNAQYYCSRAAWQQVAGISATTAFSKGILKALIPDDFSERVRFVEDIAPQQTDDILGQVHDLFHDDSIQVFHVPGHAAGQIGIKMATGKQTYLLVADACWDKRAYEALALPHPIVKLFFHSWKDYKQSISTLKKYHEAHPDHRILPTHCVASTDAFVSDTLYLDAL